MALWFTEQHTDDVRFSIHIKEQLYSGKSYYQQIEVFDSYEFGRVLVLDGYIMLTEKDEYIYHEMMVHVPMACNPDIRRVLVIGAGDGGTVRELCRYDSITQIDMVEIDEQVVKVCKEYGTPVFMKDSLRDLMRDGFRQEFPWVVGGSELF